ncbi:hypothetical protein [Aliikangiella sp. G2MR2-5]|uniref:hypothetical protein n=1 Tax=Aliikangiella sp. G2MR2-5 TaxID=2788943 RepID=UPI0018AA0FCE|nr:hypothetical protein [Aliikangiella sp. G2MR2-5]
MNLIDPLFNSSLGYPKPRQTREDSPRTENGPRTDSPQQTFKLRNEANPVRVIRVAKNGVEVSEFGNRTNDTLSTPLARRNSPSNQYQQTEELLRKEALSNVFSVDIYV